MNDQSGRSVTRFITITLLLTALLPMSILGAYWIVHEISHYKEHAEHLVDDFMSRNRSRIKWEVVSVLDFIQREATVYQARRSAQLKNQTLQAHKVASYTHKRFLGSLPPSERQQSLLDAIEFTHANIDPARLLVFDHRGAVLLDLQPAVSTETDRNSQRTLDAKTIFTILKQVPEQVQQSTLGIPSKSNGKTSAADNNIAYFKRFKPLDWIIVSFFPTSALNDTHFKSQLILQIKSLQPTYSRYIFVADAAGNLLLGPYAGSSFFEMKDPHGKPIRETLQALQSKEGGFVEYVLEDENLIYQGPKLSYVSFNRDLQWFVGAGMLFEELDKSLADNQRSLNHTIRDFVRDGAVLFGLLLLLIIVTVRFLNRRIIRHVSALTEMLEDAVTHSRLQDENRFRFRENRYLVRHINEIISKKLASEKARSKSELKYRLLFMNLRDGYVETDVEDRIVEVNDSFCGMTGYSRAELLALSITDVIDLKMAPEDMEIYKELLLQTGYSELFEMNTRRKDGSFFAAEIQLYAVYEDEDFIGIRGLIRDISERKEAERREHLQHRQLIQADKLISLGILTSGVAHEINNPNQFIITHHALIKDIWEDSQRILDHYAEENGDFPLNGLPYSTVRENIPTFFKNVTEGTHRIQKIVSELKEFARDNPDDALEQIEINSVVESAVTLVYSQIKKATDHFSVSYGKRLPQMWGHYQRLEQVIINLIQNACQALPDRKSAIEVTTGFSESDNRLLVSVVDQGKGIAAEDLNRITDPFFTTRRDSGGTGLGLSISERIVNQHNGVLDFSSVPGKGTTARLVLPINKHDSIII